MTCCDMLIHTPRSRPRIEPEADHGPLPPLVEVTCQRCAAVRLAVGAGLCMRCWMGDCGNQHTAIESPAWAKWRRERHHRKRRFA